MKYAIFLNTVLPVRAEAKECSEMVTQLLFGDSCEILDEEGLFYKIKNSFDEYIGWADRKMLSEIDQSTFDSLVDCPVFRSNIPLADVFCMSDKTFYRLSFASLLPLYDYEKSTFGIAGKMFQIHPSFVTYISESSKQNIIETARIFLNTPYLWGGKNILGIDCSGFIQVVYSLNGFVLPRDASAQINEGQAVNGLSEALPTDLCFFEKDGKITHVGIYMDDGKIIHASGKVRIDKVDEQGIFNEEISDYTHKLAAIKRI